MKVTKLAAVSISFLLLGATLPCVARATQFEISSALRIELERMGRVLSRYGAVVEEPTPVANLIAVGVFDPLITYLDVDQIENCRDMHVYSLPEDRGRRSGRIQPVACTLGYMTYVRGAVLRRMPVREQAKVFVHEAMHRTGRHEDGTIADLTNGLAFVLGLEDRIGNGERPRLNDPEANRIERLLIAIERAGLRNRDPLVGCGNHRARQCPHGWSEIFSAWSRRLRVHRYGGGLISDGVRASPDAFVGVGAVLAAVDSALDAESFIDRALLAARQVQFHDLPQTSRPTVILGRRAFVDQIINVWSIALTLRVGVGARISQFAVGPPTHYVQGSREDIAFFQAMAAATTSHLDLATGSTVEEVRWESRFSDFGDRRRAIPIPSGVSLSLGERASLRRTEIGATTGFYGSSANVALADGVQIDFEHRPVCSGDRKVHFDRASEPVTLTSASDLQSLCERTNP